MSDKQGERMSKGKITVTVHPEYTSKNYYRIEKHADGSCTVHVAPEMESRINNIISEAAKGSK